MIHKFNCDSCDWHGTEEQVLKAKNPFNETEELLGCPVCKYPETLNYACAEPNCWNDIGYGNTCAVHIPDRKYRADHFHLCPPQIKK